MQLRAEQVQAGHHIGGAKVLWTRPMPGGAGMVIAVEVVSLGPGARIAAWPRCYHRDELVEVEELVEVDQHG